MITQEDVSYSEETIENLTAAQIRDIYEDSVLLWMCGSGSGVGHLFFFVSCRPSRFDAGPLPEDLFDWRCSHDCHTGIFG